MKSSFLILIAGTVALSIWSVIGALDVPTWAFELSVAWLGVGILLATNRRFPFSDLFYIVCLIHFAILAIGAKYTYAEAPPGDWMQNWFQLDRNPFDRVGHYAQGFTPALLVRELLLRASPLRKGWMVPVFVVAVPLAFSALYELIEWWIVIFFYPNAGPEWLGHQGDIWDAQADMFMALLGALTVLIAFSRLHNRSMNQLGKESDPNFSK